MMGKIGIHLFRRISGPLVLLGAWQLASSVGWLPASTLAPPRDVLIAGARLVEDGSLLSALGVSVQRVALGAGSGIIVGTALALVAGLAPIGDDVIDSLMQFLRTLPVLALVPLFILWFGIGEELKVILIATAVTFPVYINGYHAIRGVDPKIVEAASIFGVGRAQMIRQVILPGALPGFLVGLRFAVSVSWLVLVVAETVNANAGLGFLMNQARTFGQTDVLVVCLLVYGLLGVVSDLVVRSLERRLLVWRPTFAGAVR